MKALIHIEPFLVFSPKRHQFTFAFQKNALLHFGGVSKKILKSDKYMHSVLIFSNLFSKELDWLVLKSQFYY